VSPWIFLAGAIVVEVCATVALRASEGFSRLWPSLFVPVGYGTAFFLLSQCLKAGFPLGTAYAVWASLGVVLVAIAGRLLFADPLTPRMIAGIGIIIVGVVLVEGVR
jgi:small multidrug resistance pump